MNTDETGNTSVADGRDHEAEVERALASAGARADLAHGELSPADFQMHHDAALMVWQRQQRRRRRRRAWGGIAVAAAIALGVIFAASWLERTATPAQVRLAESFVVALVEGEVEILAPGAEIERWRPLAADDRVGIGSRIRTLSGAVVIRAGAADGLELRVDGGSELGIEGPTRAALERGRLYVDTGERGAVPADSPPAPRMVVSTPVGDAVDVGTQYEVRADRESVGVRVRSGRVELRPHESLPVTVSDLLVEPGTGVELFVDGRVESADIDVLDGSWDWSGRLATPFELDGATLGSYLDWLRRETGWAIRFESAGARSEAESVRLRGSSTAGLLPAETVDLVLPSAGYRAERTTDGLAIRPIS